jgi:hypothetical protein
MFPPLVMGFRVGQSQPQPKFVAGACSNPSFPLSVAVLPELIELVVVELGDKL